MSKVPRETLMQVRERFGRAMMRLIHPTVPPTRNDVVRFAYALKVYEKEVAAWRVVNRRRSR